ncbi:glycosyltransferase family protein [Flavobacterium subsaxonicum]|uniref:Glycosyl transferase n=1 Tax=Flavobacterium subsaxonicum WB 4.1-42 = DSM 21790 TaxID=1121898 RepID=A0A0A2MI14_9FLAO|nr:glycosyltransferase family protein [Flavobacterium subsaxonicum]KGO91201.1 glycosyl transferase [Flavobacterium subsaxonicum WB 4.1-42 = DSM 21790]
MKILYAIQGTGNGHLSRAIDIIPCLQKHGEVDILVSGTQGDLQLPFPVKYKVKGLSFIFGKSGGVDLWKTVTKSHIRKLIKSIRQLPVEDYDLVVNDFEPVSAWACYFKDKPCIALSHQSAVLNKQFPKPDVVDKMGLLILKNYAPADYKYGFHFKGNNDTIFTPVIRQQVRNHEITNEGHYTVYLPSYDDKTLISRLSEYKDIKWDVFSKHNTKAVVKKNITIQPINNAMFTASMASSSGVLCGAGFETPAEALYLGKKLLVIPMKNQYEQQLNAAALQAMGVPVIKSLKPKYEPVIANWLQNGTPIPVDYKDVTQQIIDRIVLEHTVVPLLI